MKMPDIILPIIFALLLLPGLAGIFLPVPGLSYMFVVALTYGFIDHFQHLTWQNLIWLALILLISILSDTFSGTIGAKYGGAKKDSLYAGIAGMVVGAIVLPPFGGLAGVFLGVLIWEIIQKTNNKKALRAASASLLGSIGGMVLSFLLSVLFILLFVIFSIH